MDNAQETMLREIQGIEFSMVDLHLFLDTHPYSVEALTLFKEYANMLEETKCEYERRYGPISPMGCNMGEKRWEWVMHPWPWHQTEGGMKHVDV